MLELDKEFIQGTLVLVAGVLLIMVFAFGLSAISIWHKTVNHKLEMEAYTCAQSKN